MTTVQPDTVATRPPDGDLIIDATEVVKTYDTGKVQVRALRGVTLPVRRGEMVAIMGPSGCGKTTLLNCLSGLDDIDSGSVLIDGADLSTLGDARRTEFRARRMGFVFQLYNLLPVLSAVENVELPLLVSGVSARDSRAKALVCGVSARDSRAKAERSLEQVHLIDWASHKPAELSGGQRQRVTIARALVNKPAIVWADEPTGDLDSTNAGEILDLMVDLNSRFAQTFVLVTHDPNIANRTHRIIYMTDGLIVDEKQVRDLD